MKYAVILISLILFVLYKMEGRNPVLPGRQILTSYRKRYDKLSPNSGAKPFDSKVYDKLSDLFSGDVEQFAGNQGTMIQLAAKGRHDQYLTGRQQLPMTRVDKDIYGRSNCDLHPGTTLKSNEIGPGKPVYGDLYTTSSKKERLPPFYTGWRIDYPDLRRSWTSKNRNELVNCQQNLVD